MKKLPYRLSLILLGFLVGCNLPGGQLTQISPDMAFTQAAETVAAELTEVSLLASPTPNEPSITPTSISTNTPIPTNTQFLSPTKTPIPCNLAIFVTDVTYPDNTRVAPNQSFIKTWQIRNVGSCSWNSSYLLIFDHGDGLGVSSGYTQPLTTGVVNSGQSVDLTVNMTAPAASGTYTGYWRMRDPRGAVFGITHSGGTFIVKVIVVANTSITIVPVISESGSVRSDGEIFTGDINVGDSVENYKIQAFISYNISSIPSNVTIIEIRNKFNSYSIGGDPFGKLGVLNCYKMDYTTPLLPTDFIAGFPAGNIADWGALSVLDNIEVQPGLKNALQMNLGSSRFKIRLQFNGTNNDGTADFIRLTNPSLIITYTTP